jgi:hypothetical protein
MMNRRWSISGLVLSILAIVVGAVFLEYGIAWARTGIRPTVAGLIGILVVMFLVSQARKRS